MSVSTVRDVQAHRDHERGPYLWDQEPRDEGPTDIQPGDDGGGHDRGCLVGGLQAG